MAQMFKPMKDNPSLSRLIEQAKKVTMKPEQVFEQRVSFVYGQLPEENTLTKDEVRQHIAEHDQKTRGAPFLNL